MNQHRMSRKIIFFVLSLFVFISSIFADQADQVFAAIKAKKDTQVASILQSLALSRNFSQLDKVLEKNPELFDAKYFSEEFLKKIIFTYIENAVANEKASLRAAGTTNPHPRNSRLWYQWNINKALADRAATKDQALKKKLTDQINKDIGVLVDALSSYIDQADKIAIVLYLGALNAGINPINLSGLTQDSEANLTEFLNEKASEEAMSILEYLFKAGIPFPSNLPASLNL